MPHLPNWKEHENVGTDKPSKEPVEQFDKDYGKYNEGITEVNTDDRLPTANMPKAPDKSPYTLK